MRHAEWGGVTSEQYCVGQKRIKGKKNSKGHCSAPLGLSQEEKGGGRVIGEGRIVVIQGGSNPDVYRLGRNGFEAGKAATKKPYMSNSPGKQSGKEAREGSF